MRKGRQSRALAALAVVAPLVGFTLPAPGPPAALRAAWANGAPHKFPQRTDQQPTDQPRTDQQDTEKAPKVPCTCRYRGEKIPLGQTICMKTPRGYVRARCALTLNNTSWEISDEPCSVAQLSSP